MSKTDETFFTTIGCMDGRDQGSVVEYGRRKEGLNQELLDSIKNKLLISFEKHPSKLEVEEV
jgi:hypothetical protein